MLVFPNELKTTFRKVTKNGVDFLVVPGVPIREMVLNDYLVPGDEISRFVGAWNGRPITINHPQQNNGSANSPEPDVQIIGAVYNCAWDETERKLSGEYWINIADASQTDEGQAVLNAIEAGETLETSTGYYADEEYAAGLFGNKRYQVIHHNLRPDHVAILPNDVGACSVSDGCGVNRNCASCPGKRKQTQVIEGDDKTALSNLFTDKESDMPKKNSGFYALLVSLGEALGVKVNVEAPKDEEQESTQAEEEKDAAPVTNAATPPPAATAQAPSPLAPIQNAEERLTLNELQAIRGYINLMTEFGGPDGFTTMLKAMQEVGQVQVTANKQAEVQKAALVGALKANARCTLSDAALNAMSADDLTALQTALQPVNYAGQGAGLATNEQGEKVAAPAPVLLAPKN